MRENPPAPKTGVRTLCHSTRLLSLCLLFSRIITWRPNSNYIIIPSLSSSLISLCLLVSFSLFSSYSISSHSSLKSFCLNLPYFLSPSILFSSLSPICFSCNILSWGWFYILRTSPKENGGFPTASVKKGHQSTSRKNRNTVAWIQWPGTDVPVEPAWIRCQPQRPQCCAYEISPVREPGHWAEEYF